MTKYINRKYDTIDLIKLRAKFPWQAWQAYMQSCYNLCDVEALKKALYGVQAGMNDLVKKKLDTQEMKVYFVNLQRSIHITMKKILKRLNPNPLDNPKIKNADYMDYLEAKRKRDIEFEKFLKECSF